MNELKMIKNMQELPKQVLELKCQESKLFAESIQSAMCRYMGHQVQHDIYRNLIKGEEINITNLREVIETCIDNVIIKIKNEDL